MLTKSILLATVATSLLGFASAASAQTAPVAASPATNEQFSQVDEVVVTARRRAEDASKVPIAISAFSAETLERQSIVTTADLTKITPGLNVSGAGSLTNPFVTIRGQTRGLAGPGTPGVLSYLNDIPLPTYGSLIPTFDMDNIQVLKGPQGTLFGRNAIGGAVLSYTRRPDYEFGGYLKGEYGNFNTMTLEGAVNIPLIPDILAVRVAAQSYSTDGYTETHVYSPSRLVAPFTTITGSKLTNSRNYDEFDNRGVRASILFEPTSYLHNTLVFDYFRASGANNVVGNTGKLVGTPVYSLPPATLTALGLGGLLNPSFHCGTSPHCDVNLMLAQTDPRVAYTDAPPEALSEILGVSNTTVLDLGANHQLKNIFGYRTTDSDQNTDIDGTALPIVQTSNTVHLKQVTNELQLSGEFLDGTLKYVAGLFYYKSSPNGLGGFQGLTINVINGLNYQTTANYLTEESKAAYAQIDYDLSAFIPGLGITAGYRQTSDSQSGCAYTASYSPANVNGPVANSQGFLPSQSQCESNSFTADPTAVPGTTSAQNFLAESDKGTYTLSLNYQASPSLLIYLANRRGYRSGGFNVPLLNVALADIQTYAPETLTDFELGTKGRYSFGGVYGTFGGNIFTGKDEGYQYFQNTTGIPLTPPGGLLINKADLTIKGFEAEGTISPVRGLTLGANTSYVKIEVDRLTVPASLQAQFNAAGRGSVLLNTIIPQQPKWQVNGSVEYIVQQPVAGGELSFNANYHYQSSYQSNETVVDGWETVDTRATITGFHGLPVDISLYVRNIFDETYALGSGSSSSGSGIFSYVYAPPRTYGASLRYSF